MLLDLFKKVFVIEKNISATKKFDNHRKKIFTFTGTDIVVLNEHQF